MVLVVVLLGFGVTVEVLCALGVLLMRNSFDRLHYLGPATLLGPLAVAAAVLVDASDTQARIKAVLIALILLATGPILTHATARAARVRQFGRLHTEEQEAKVAK